MHEVHIIFIPTVERRQSLTARELREQIGVYMYLYFVQRLRIVE